MKHSYLLEEATWSASGHFIDAEGQQLAVKGTTAITHTATEWNNIGAMTVLSEQPTTFENYYRITPFGERQQHTTWISHNPALGQLAGTFALVGDSILSQYTSEDGQYVGSEYMQRISRNCYLNRGVLFAHGQRISSWVVHLQKEPIILPGYLLS